MLAIQALLWTHTPQHDGDTIGACANSCDHLCSSPRKARLLTTFDSKRTERGDTAISFIFACLPFPHSSQFVFQGDQVVKDDPS